MKTSRIKITRVIFLMLALATGLAMISAFRANRVSASASVRSGLTMAERVAYQRAIEDVYRRHRAANPQARPAAGMTTAQLEAKVAGYLRKSQALESVWRRPVTAEQLQAEMDRIARHTKAPALLGELYQALGNDPLVIAECLARPTLVEREIRDAYARDARLNSGERKETFEQWWAQAEQKTGLAEPTPAHSYRLQPVASAAVACTNDTWQPTTLTGAPTPRSRHTAVWTGAEMIIWGGGGTNTGGRYNPATDSWTPTSVAGAPTARDEHTAVWTGAEMIVWGSFTSTGGRYNPATDTWTATSLTGAPDARSQHTAVWTGAEMIVWGGVGESARLNTGGRYNPMTNSWTATSGTGAPAGRRDHTAVWTGTEMIVWGGSAEGLSITNTGGRYNPGADSWTPTSTLGAAGRRIEHSAIWTGTEMIVWGGELNNVSLNTGARYHPITDSWKGVSMTLPPEERDDFHRAVWTGTEMIVWGGTNLDDVDLNTGGRYNPGADSWTPTSETGAPIGRDNLTAVWTGSEMIVWGGSGGPETNTGGRYCAQTGGGGPANTPPAIAGTGLTRAAGSPGASAQIASVSDAQDAAGSLTVTVNGGSSATASGVSVSGLSVNSSGQVTATVGASCTASSASFTLRVTDGGGLFDEATLDVAVNANTPPTLGTYPATSVTPDGGATVMPSVPPSDNGSIASLTASAPGFTGTLAGNPTTGVITITNANPPGSYTVTVTATDNCGAQATRTFTLTVATASCSVTVNPATLPQAYLAVQYSAALSASPAGGYTFSVSAGALPPGLQLRTSGAAASISGTPATPGTFNFTIKARHNDTACEGARGYTVTIPTTVIPILECVQRTGSNTYVARFGYNNSTGAAVTIPVGANNYFAPGNQNRGQTTVFQPGRVVNAFSVTLTKGNGANLAVWYLRGPDGVLRSVSALTTSISCP